MKLTTALMAGAIVAGFVLPATAQDYYVVQSSKSKTCTITQQRPTGSEMTVVEPNGATYTTRTEAENAMKTIKVCHSD